MAWGPRGFACYRRGSLPRGSSSRHPPADGHAPFSDLIFAIEVGPLVSGDFVVGRWKAEGAYAGGIPGATAPAGTPVTYRGTDILRAEGNRFVEYWVSADVFQLMADLGVG